MCEAAVADFSGRLVSLQNRASCRGLQATGRGKAAPPLSRPALACSSRRHIHVPERFCKPLDYRMTPNSPVARLSPIS